MDRTMTQERVDETQMEDLGSVQPAVQQGENLLTSYKAGRWVRFKVWLALKLLKGSACTVARREHVEIMRWQAFHLGQYVQHSGGLQDPRRIRAYRIVLRAAASLVYLAKNIEAQ